MGVGVTLSGSLIEVLSPHIAQHRQYLARTQAVSLSLPISSSDMASDLVFCPPVGELTSAFAWLAPVG